MASSTKLAKYYTADRPEFVNFAKKQGTFSHAIDIGCAGGRLGGDLITAGVLERCDGIEPNPDAAALARQTLNEVWSGSFEANASVVPWERYDLLIMADVLEHLVDPWSALRQLREVSRPTCRLMLSVPNIRHYKVLLPLLFRGEFGYRDHGIMDRTHLHFFTASSIEDTLSECGWKMVLRSSHMKSSYRRRLMPTRMLEPFVAVQYLMTAEKR